MHTEIQTKWIDALLSGEYEQAKFSLKSEEGFCCLGVLCDLYLKEHNEEWTSPIPAEDQDCAYPSNPNVFNIEGETGGLPLKVMRWAGLESSNPIVRQEYRGYNKASLAVLNDSSIEENTFEKIAELVKTL